eukprot:2360689-Prymnesium_polylepis.1
MARLQVYQTAILMLANSFTPAVDANADATKQAFKQLGGFDKLVRRVTVKILWRVAVKILWLVIRTARDL